MNLRAAQEWECPCRDRFSCLSPDRLDEGPLYEHRKACRLRNGCGRDHLRTEMQQHFGKETDSFSRSFVIAGRNDNCIAAYGLASGSSFSTFAAARADCRKSRPMKAGRKRVMHKKMSHARGVIDAYIRSQIKTYYLPIHYICCTHPLPCALLLLHTLY